MTARSFIGSRRDPSSDSSTEFVNTTTLGCLGSSSAAVASTAALDGGDLHVPPLSLVYYLQGVSAQIIFEAFQRDCAQRKLAWEEESAQRFASDLFLRHPLVLRCPPRHRVLQSFLKLYIDNIEQQIAVRQKSGDDRAEEWGDPILSDLLSAHIDGFLLSDKAEQTMCYKSFLNVYVPSPSAQGTKWTSRNAGISIPGSLTVTPDELCNEQPSGKCTGSACIAGSRVSQRHSPWSWTTTRVGCDQFHNVGLSLWPAAFALVQLLAQEFSNESNLIPTLASAFSKRVRVVELGAGVGLTPCALDGLPGFREKVSRFAATDYQIELIENMRSNFRLNKLQIAGDVPCPLEGKVLPASSQQECHMTQDNATPLPLSEDGKEVEACASHVESHSKASDSSPVSYSLQLLDWTEREQCESFFSVHGSDLILAADCIYDVSVVPALVEVIAAGLRATNVEDAVGDQLWRQRHSQSPPGAVKAAVVVQTHRQASTMKVFFEGLARENLSVESYRLIQLSWSEAQELVSKPGNKYTPLGRWSSQDPVSQAIAKESAVVPLLRPDIILLDGTFESLSRELPPSNESQTNLLKDGFIGPYYVNMVGLVGVHVVTLSH